MLHLLPAGELGQHDTDPDRRCRCGGQLELVDAGEVVGWQYVHQSLEGEPVPKPSLGRIVLTHVDPSQNNGSTTAPAVITRVWSDEMVNLRVFCDAFTMPLSKTSVRLLDEEPSAGDARHTAWWPPRV